MQSSQSKFFCEKQKGIFLARRITRKKKNFFYLTLFFFWEKCWKLPQFSEYFRFSFYLDFLVQPLFVVCASDIQFSSVIPKRSLISSNNFKSIFLWKMNVAKSFQWIEPSRLKNWFWPFANAKCHDLNVSPEPDKWIDAR